MKHEPLRQRTRWALLLGLLVLLAGCAAPQRQPSPDAGVWNDALFGPPAQAPDPGAIFALTGEMQRYLDERIRPQARRRSAQSALLDALYAQRELRLEYDASFTRNAHQAFEARMGNCLSLVIMTGAFAQELGLMVRYQEVLGPPAVERNGGLTFLVGHVNVAMGSRPRDLPISTQQEHWVTVDFLPGQDLGRQRTQEIGIERVRAMFMNNRAAEELSRGRPDDAYAWLRAAWREDPAYVNLYNTLGVLYRQRGALPEAERALLVARTMDPDNSHVLDNLNGVQLALGRAVEPRRQAVRAETGGRFDRARAALDGGQFKQAIALLNGELGLTPRNAELHHWLAVAHSRIGDMARAQRHLELAAEFSRDPERQRYAGKLDLLRAQLRALQ